MSSSSSTFTSINDYIASTPAEVQPILTEIRRLIAEAVPEGQEAISYKMPAFKLGRTFIYFAAFKKHIGVYPPVTDDEALIKALQPYRNEKGNLSFPLTQAIPYALIERVAVALAKQYAKK